MFNPQAPDPHPVAPLQLLVAADLQDNLLAATHDLDRLQNLLAHACDELMQGFHGATSRLKGIVEGPDRQALGPELYDAVMRELSNAVTALQFQDMASQLIAHTNKRLRNCADRIAREAMAEDDEGPAVVEEAPMRPNPVTQDEMDAGSIELF
jgi:hypothetical protein